MSVPPSFSDLGKAARDIFSKGFSEYQTISMMDRMQLIVKNKVAAVLQFLL